MGRTGRALAIGFLVLTGAGFLTLAGGGIAHAQSGATPTTCTEIASTLNSFTASLKANQAKYASDHAAYVAAAGQYGNQILQITAPGSPALRSAAKAYVTEIEADVAANDINTIKLSAAFNRLAVLACTPKGAPATGGGSSAALQDPGLFGAGGAAALAGLIVVGLTLRNRSRVSVEAR